LKRYHFTETITDNIFIMSIPH